MFVLSRDLETRNLLRNKFWVTIDSYLHELECPKGYLEANNGVLAWHRDPSLRIRVVYWIVSCATSELNAEKLDPKEEQVVVTVGKEPKPTPVKLILPPELDLDLDPNAFPLGFSTGDNQVDHILILLRMNFLNEIELEQRQYNQLLADSILETSRDKQSKTTSKKSGRQRGRR